MKTIAAKLVEIMLVWMRRMFTTLRGDDAKLSVEFIPAFKQNLKGFKVF